jgi:hypothetical protein
VAATHGRDSIWEVFYIKNKNTKDQVDNTNCARHQVTPSIDVQVRQIRRRRSAQRWTHRRRRRSCRCTVVDETTTREQRTDYHSNKTPVGKLGSGRCARLRGLQRRRRARTERQAAAKRTRSKCKRWSKRGFRFVIKGSQNVHSFVRRQRIVQSPQVSHQTHTHTHTHTHLPSLCAAACDR